MHRRQGPWAHSQILVNIVKNHYLTLGMIFFRYPRSLVQAGSAQLARAKSYSVLARRHAQTLIVRPAVGSSPRWATFRRFHVTRHNARSQALFATKIGPRSAPAMGLMGLLDELASGACRRAAARSQCVMRAYSVQRACQMRAQRSIWRGSCCRPRVRCACGRATRAMRARCGS